MDLARFRFEHDASVAQVSPDLAVLLVGIVARQAASPTAIAQARIAPAAGSADGAEPVFFPASGAFDDRTAGRIRHWKEE